MSSIENDLSKKNFLSTNLLIMKINSFKVNDQLNISNLNIL